MPLVEEVRELGQVGLAEQDRARGAQLGDDRRVLGRDAVLERDRARGGRHAGRVEVVLDDHRDAVQRAADVAGGALGVERGRLLQRLRVEQRGPR